MHSDFKLETSRLMLRRLTFDDASFIEELLNTSGWLQHIGDKNILGIEEAQSYIKKGPMSYYQMGLGMGLHAVVLKDHNIPIGLCGLLKRTYLETPDIGYAILPKFEGKGLMKEACLRTLKYSKEELNLGSIAAITSRGNERSIGLLIKLGFNFVKTLDLNDERINHYQKDL